MAKFSERKATKHQKRKVTKHPKKEGKSGLWLQHHHKQLKQIKQHILDSGNLQQHKIKIIDQNYKKKLKVKHKKTDPNQSTT